jgi:two-component system, cell cycle sensor histidine kinase and response regulator CckA
MIRRWWRSSVQFRLVSFFLLLSWSSVVTVGTLAYVRARQELSASTLTRLEASAALKGDELRRWIIGQRRDLLVLATWPDLKRTAAVALDDPSAASTPAPVSPACASTRTLFAGVLKEKPDLREIFILTTVGGRIVCSSDAAHIGESRALDAYSVKGREQTFVQTVYPSPVTGHPLVSLATPLGEAGTDRELGVLAAHLNLDEMDRIMRAPHGLGQGSEIYLVDRYNVFISAARFGRPRYPRGIHSRGIDAAVSGETGKGQYANYDGTAVLGAWRWIDELGVAIVAEMPEAAALAPSRRLAWTILTAGFISAGALAIGVLVLARRITSPLLAINRAARGVAAGDLTQHAPVATDDEVGMLAQSFNEMTDQLRGLYGELADSAARFTKVFDASPMAIAITTFEEGRYVDVNPRWLQLIGRTRDEVIGRTAKEIGVWADPEDRDTVIANLREHAILYDIETRLRTKSGEVRECATSLARIVLADTPCLVSMFSDVTDRKRTERALQASQDQLRQAQKLEAIGRLAGGIAHDFNNLLTIIIGYSDMMVNRAPPGDGGRGELEEIRKAGQQAAALTQQLLAFSRKQVLAPRILDLNAVIANLDRMLQRLVGEHIQLVTRLGTSLGPVLVDQAQIEQVIVNLAVNARDAMPTGGTLTIETENVELGRQGRPAGAEPAGSFVTLRVRDTGTGMDAETRQRVFEPFFTTKPQGKGTGLGLATIYGIVQQSHGHIEIESAVGRGSVFTVFLPRAAGAAEPRPVTVPVRTTHGSETILVAEDEDVVRHLIRDVLRTHGYQVLEAADGREALTIASSHPGPIDLVMSDVVMPGISGLEVIDRMSQLRPRARAILISGYADDAIAAYGVMDPSITLINKPFQLHELTQRVREVLDRALPDAVEHIPAPPATRRAP